MSKRYVKNMLDYEFNYCWIFEDYENITNTFAFKIKRKEKKDTNETAKRNMSIYKKLFVISYLYIQLYRHIFVNMTT